MSDPRDAHRVPPATHWNYLRHPVHSFSCPRCHERIMLKPVIMLDGEEGIYGSCENCDQRWLASGWAQEKAVELPFFEGDW